MIMGHSPRFALTPGCVIDTAAPVMVMAFRRLDVRDAAA
jgi:hypothetical protein